MIARIGRIPYPLAIAGRRSGASAASDYDPVVVAWKAAIDGVGGSIGPATLAAIDSFVKKLKLRGVWDSIYSLNLCCGGGGSAEANFAASRVWIKHPIAPTSPTYYNFVSADFNQLTGLQGNATVKKYCNVGHPLPQLDSGILLHSHTDALGAWADAGASNGSTQTCLVGLKWQTVGPDTSGFVDFFANSTNNGRVFVLNFDSRGVWQLCNSGNRCTVFKRDLIYDRSTNAGGTVPTPNLTFWGQNGTGGIALSLVSGRAYSLTGTVINWTQAKATAFWEEYKSFCEAIGRPHYGDTDVDNYRARILAAGGTVSSRVLSATYDFVLRLKEVSIWNDIYVLNLGVGSGGTADQNLIGATVPLKHPTGQNYSLFNISSAHFTEATGFQGDGASRYISLNCGLPETNNIGLFLQSHTTNSALTCSEMGAVVDASGNGCYLRLRHSTDNYSFTAYSPTEGKQAIALNNSTGIFQSWRDFASNAIGSYRSGSSIGQSVGIVNGGGTRPPANKHLFLLALNSPNGTPVEFANRRISASGILTNWSAAKAGTFNTRYREWAITGVSYNRSVSA